MTIKDVAKSRLGIESPKDLAAQMFRRSMLWQPDRIAQSAWLEHVPFAFWLVDVLRPKRIVELGTHFGVSYSAMCQAVRHLGLATSCFAIDTWKGDDQAGFYDESVFHEFSEFHDRHYGGFSRLVRSTFDDALGHFGDETIDLLHIDGQHAYEAVRHDYESWRPKLSANSIVLFHDSNVREGDFGVFRFWRELTKGHLHFSFLHGHGLGVLGLGNNFSSELKLLFRANEDDHLCASVRESFRSLGRSVHVLFDLGKLQESVTVNNNEVAALRGEVNERDSKNRKLKEELAARVSETESFRHRLLVNENEIAQFKNEIAQRDSKALMLENEIAARSREVEVRDKRVDELKTDIAALKDEILNRSRELSLLEEGIAKKDREIADFRRSAAENSVKINYLESVVRELYRSTSWRITAPLRRLRRAFNKDLLEPIVPSQKALILPVSTLSQKQSALLSQKQSAFKFRLVYISSEWHSPGHTYRVIHLVNAALKAGFDASWIKLEEVSDHLSDLSNADAVIFWRTAWDPRVEMAMGVARQAGARVVFDVDDLMIDPTIACMSVIDGIRTQALTEEQVRTHFELVRRTMLEADLCTTTTEEIAAYMRLAGKPTFVIPNGFDHDTLRSSRLAVRSRRKTKTDDIVRIGYASGSRTHQRDFALVAGAVARILRERPHIRLVLFRDRSGKAPYVDLSEYGALRELSEQIEWRDFVALENLPEEIARFDLNIAPLEVGNAFCEAKSELKFFEAALVDVVTVASPTGPFRRAIRNGENGFLAGNEVEWYVTLLKLVDDSALRSKVARSARYEAIRKFGPMRRTNLLKCVIAQIVGGSEAADAFELETTRSRLRVTYPQVAEAEVVFESDNCRASEVTVVMPVFNYAHYIIEALESVRRQTLSDLDLVLVDDCSTDDSVAVTLRWLKRNVGRFNRLVLLRNRYNVGLGLCRNVAFDAAETTYVLPFDPDNRLLPLCCERLLADLKNTDLAFVYPNIQQFGAGSALMGTQPFEAQRFVSGNYIDAMALISKEAWVGVGGYVNMWGWEDYDFWCGFVEQGLRGRHVNELLAEYRVHDSSMLRTMTERPDNKQILLETISRRHPWLALKTRAIVDSNADKIVKRKYNGVMGRLETLLPHLRCPETGAPLTLTKEGDLWAPSTGRYWPVVNEIPILYPGMAEPEIKPDSHVSNALPKVALDMINESRGLVLNLSAGGTTERYDHVIEAEAAIFRHTDAVVDAHKLPFADETFEAVFALNAFEHYRDPRRVANEIMRILQPGGRVLIHTAFLQPLHERPWHYYNCTRYGLELWFEGFDCERIQVSENFAPNYAISWLACECEAALRRDVSPVAAEAFATTPIGVFSRFWREPESRTDPRWTALSRLPQESQEFIAAGFEFVGRKPDTKSH